MDRRAFIGRVAGGLLAVPFATAAQQAGRLPRIGVLLPGNTGTGTEVLRQGLRQLGYVTSRAQQPAKVARIGFLGANSASSWASRLESFRLGLRELGYVDGTNIVIEFRWADERYDRLPAWRPSWFV